MYSERVRYADQLRRYRALFGTEQVLVLIYDDFRKDNEETVRRVLRFLEVDDAIPVKTTEANPTVACARSSSTTSSTPSGRRGPSPGGQVDRQGLRAGAGAQRGAPSDAAPGGLRLGAAARRAA